ncbi:MFS transporter [Streptomyces sp. TLI_171]|uniref:MFS transporter n=1 Tax=Streptomyces sp. TLI_171 TaxID=1938859 RepID=UPI000C178873|nr:MFS transporter [Streptomyces sp. TLI_171]RKE22000.1 putative MFS family arabinose efflux permease [Streptomyces sp. TLI_171]
MSTTPAVRAQDSTFRAVLGSPHVARLLGGTLIGRLPTGMAPIAILLLARAEHGPLALAGLLGALYGLAAAIGQPLLGRLVDRHGQRTVLCVSAPVASAAFLLLPATGPVRHPVLAALVVVLAGLASPPLESCLRALWPRVLPDDGRRHAALALDSGSQGLVFVAGPLLAAGLTAGAGVLAAFTATAALGLFGAALVTTSAPCARWTASTLAGRGHWAGPLRAPGLRVLFAALAGTGMALGAVNVLALSLSDRHHAGWLAGVMPAALSFGSVLGGLAYGRRAWPGPPARHLVAAATGFAAGWTALLSDPVPAVALLGALLPGSFLAPLLAAAFQSVERLAPEGELAEASAWLVACIGVGQAAGTALCSLAVAAGPLPAALVPLAGAAAALWLLRRFHHLLPA